MIQATIKKALIRLRVFLCFDLFEIVTLTVQRRWSAFVDLFLIFLIYVSCLSLLCGLVWSLQPCVYLLDKGWPLGSLVCCICLRFCQLSIWCFGSNISQCMRFPTMCFVQPAKPQISLRIRVSKLHRRLQRLVRVYTCVTLLAISCHGSYMVLGCIDCWLPLYFVYPY